jgi:hypothetical protein
MSLVNCLLQINGGSVQDFLNTQVKPEARATAKGFNYNKMQAVLCMMSSSFVSIALIVWAFKTLL